MIAIPTVTTIKFKTTEDAVKVAEQLYNCEVEGKNIIVTDLDRKALKLAISLTGAQLEDCDENNQTLDPFYFPSHRRECKDSSTPVIYVSCLAAYNAGHLHGMFIDATQEPDEIYDDINFMLSWSPVRHTQECEEWAIHDYENFEGIRISEYEDIETVSALANAMLNHDEAFAAFYSDCSYSKVDDAIEAFENSYYGEYKSAEDFAYELAENCGFMLDEKHPFYHYVNFAAYARDLELNGDFNFIEVAHDRVYVFDNHY